MTRKLNGPLWPDYQIGPGSAIPVGDAPLSRATSIDGRLDTAESTITSHGTRLTTAETDIATAEANIARFEPLIRTPAYVAALGDSITLGNGSTASGYLGSNVPFTWACLLSNGVLVPVALGNLGVAGQTSTQIAARVSSVTALSPRPGRCFVMAGTNDCGGSLDITTYATNIATIVSGLRSSNIEPILLLIPPKSANATEVAKVNAWLSGYGGKNGVQVIDTYTPYQDASTGSWQSGLDSDGTHPSAATAKLMGQVIWDAIKDRINPNNAVLPSGHASDPVNLVTNGVFVGDTNADGTANSWVWNSGQTSSDSVQSGGTTVPGNWQRMLLSNTGLTGYFNQTISSGWSVGDTILFCGRVRGTLSANENMTARLKFNGATQTYMSSVFAIDQSISSGDGYAFSMVGLVPSGTTSIEPQLLGTGASSSNPVDFAQITVRNLTTLGLA